MNNYFCNFCDFCNFCNSCYSCDFCNFCYFCDSCYSCKSCDFCDSCYSCKSCNFCKNLKMTEYNLFCYSLQYNDENSIKQNLFRAFNKEVGKERYNEILKLVRKIIPNPNKLKLQDFWKSITQNQWKQLLSIPEARDFKEGFEYISGVKIDINILRHIIA